MGCPKTWAVRADELASLSVTWRSLLLILPLRFLWFPPQLLSFNLQFPTDGSWCSTKKKTRRSPQKTKCERQKKEVCKTGRRTWHVRHSGMIRLNVHSHNLRSALKNYPGNILSTMENNDCECTAILLQDLGATGPDGPPSLKGSLGGHHIFGNSKTDNKSRTVR